MIRNSTAYRRMWYVKRRNIGGVRVMLRLLFIVGVLAALLAYMNRILMPAMIRTVEYKTQTLVNQAVCEAVTKSLEMDIPYEKLTTVSRDRDGRITSLQMNYSEINKIASGISEDVEQALNGMERETLSLPAGTLLGSNVLSGSGPDIKVKVMLAGGVQTEFKSELVDAGINQTKLKIFLEVRSTIGMTAPFLKRSMTVTTIVPVSETLVVGTVPYIYEGNR